MTDEKVKDDSGVTASRGARSQTKECETSSLPQKQRSQSSSNHPMGQGAPGGTSDDDGNSANSQDDSGSHADRSKKR
jgi:hypothetical protein